MDEVVDVGVEGKRENWNDQPVRVDNLNIVRGVELFERLAFYAETIGRDSRCAFE